MRFSGSRFIVQPVEDGLGEFAGRDIGLFVVAILFPPAANGLGQFTIEFCNGRYRSVRARHFYELAEYTLAHGGFTISFGTARGNAENAPDVLYIDLVRVQS